MGILDDLEWRGLIADVTDREALRAQLATGQVTLYAGFDPTGDSLHVGHFLPLLSLRRFQLAGHRPIALVGGVTGMVGDPGGRSSERNLLTNDQVAANVAGIRGQIERLLTPVDGAPEPIVTDNVEWLGPLRMVDFLRDVGKHFTVNYMLAKDSVSSRMGGDAGISYTEFSYMLLQAADFRELYDLHGCTLQIGGSDQWGNITAGTELIRKSRHATTEDQLPRVFGLTFPLLLKSDGTKFGKSATGQQIWLDADRTSPYELYQYFLNTAGDDVSTLLRRITLLPREEIEALDLATAERPQAREAQRALARWLTTFLHGEDATRKVEEVSAALFGGGDLRAADPAFVEAALAGAPSVTQSGPTTWAQLAVDAGLEKGLGAVRRTVADGGLYANNARIDDSDAQVQDGDWMHGSLLLLRKGKRNYVVVRRS
ncbi:MAG: tyrosine--tRNA ligase [Frankiales bacterium]|nr:tyrosine--tRNA ligase [Frankiales bacterium]